MISVPDYKAGGRPELKVLALNSGSSSLKFGLYRVGPLRTDMLISGEDIGTLGGCERAPGAFCAAYSSNWGTWQVRWSSQWNRSKKNYIAISMT